MWWECVKCVSAGTSDWHREVTLTWKHANRLFYSFNTWFTIMYNSIWHQWWSETKYIYLSTELKYSFEILVLHLSISISVNLYFKGALCHFFRINNFGNPKLCALFTNAKNVNIWLYSTSKTCVSSSKLLFLISYFLFVYRPITKLHSAPLTPLHFRKDIVLFTPLHVS